MVRLLLPFFLLLSSFVQAALEPVPDWVLSRSLPTDYQTPLAETQEGVHYLLVDTQINAQTPVQVYTQIAVQVLNQTGVEQQSQLSFDYDPSYEQIAIHRVGVMRGGKYSDRYASADIKQLQRETELENLIHNGLYTLNLVLKDVQVGDVLVYSYTTTGQNPVYAGHFGTNLRLSWSVPVERVDFSLLWPYRHPLYVQMHQTELTPTVSRENGYTRYALSISRPKVIEREEGAPEWYDPWSAISFSEFDNWGGVVDWAVPLYHLQDKRAAEVEALARQIMDNHPHPKARIAEALRFAQGEIRYLGLELGQDSHRPATPAETLARRFGDCKAKVMLFNDLLMAMGITAYPALVNSQTTYRLREQQPRINAFNHAITYLELDGRAYWLDPTRRPQSGSLDDVHQPQYGYGLIIRPGNQDLTPIALGSEANTISIADTFYLSDDSSASLRVDSLFKGVEAEWLRAQFESKSVTERRQEYVDFYRKLYGDLSAEQDLVHDNTESGNGYWTQEKYNFAEFWPLQEGSRSAEFYAYYLSENLHAPEPKNRTQPFQLEFPKDLTQTIKVYLPDAEWSFEPESKALNNDFFEFSKTVTFDQKNLILTLSYHLKILKSQVPAERMAEYAKAVAQARDELEYGIYQNLQKAGAFDDLKPIHVLYAMVAFYSLVCLFWRIEKKLWPEPEGGYFFPVATPKFIAMYLLTFGLYGVYWFYRSFRWLKVQRQDDSMPVARAIFSQFWFLALWKGLRDFGHAQQLRHRLPPLAFGVVAAVVYLAAYIVSGKSDYSAYGFLVAGACLIPMVNFVAYANSGNGVVLAYHSRFNFRHLLLAVVSIPILAFFIGANFGLTPEDRVVSGDKLSSFARSEILRTGAVKPDDTLLYFYSDSAWSFRKDGNGMTERHVFSYWSEDGAFNLESAGFNDVAELKLTKSTTWAENSILTVIRNDGSEFLLFLPNQGQDDVRFYHELSQRIKSTKGRDG